MNIYVVTENNFFYLGVKEILTESEHVIQKLDPFELKASQLGKFKNTDVFIFHTVNYPIELSFLLVDRKVPGRVIFTQTKRKPVRFSVFGEYRVLGYNDDANMLINMLNDDIDYDEQMVNKCNILTEWELVVMSLVMTGMTVPSIGHLLCISTKSVYAHRRSALDKLGGRNLFEILLFRG